MNQIPGLTLRTSADAEMQGIDYNQFNEFTQDYIEFQRDLYATTPKRSSGNTLVTVTTIDTENIIHKQNHIKMSKINPIPMTNNEW
jgi:hypothetical protein